MTAIDEMLANAAAYAERFEKGHLPTQPARKVAVLACMDSRIIPTRLLGLEEGDAHVIRNAGGVVTDDSIRSLAISQHLLGTDEILLLHHTECGLLSITDDEFAELLEEHAGKRPDWSAQAFQDLDESVRESMRRIRESPFIPRTDNVRGFIYDVATGRIREVE